MTVLNVWLIVQLTTNWGWFIYTLTTKDKIPKSIGYGIPVVQIITFMVYLYCAIFVKI